MNTAYKSIGNEQGDEIFSDMFVTWNITKLLNCIENLQIEPRMIDKSVYEQFIKPNQEVNESKVDHVDLSKPIIIIERYKNRHILIDGIHRVRKAKKNSIKSIPAYVLPFSVHIEFITNERDFKFIIEEYNKIHFD